MWNARRAVTLGATFLVATTLVVVFAALPPLAGLVLAVMAACGWCAWLETSWRSVLPGATIGEAAAPPMRSYQRYGILPYLTDARGFVAATLSVIAVTGILGFALRVSDPTIAALLFLLVVVIVAAVSSWRVAVATSLLAFFAFNFFFLPPTGTLVIADAQHWVALFTLLFVSLVASYLSSEVRARASELTKAEVARHSAELKSSLLASLGHDLKTPLTALTVAANSLQASWLTDEQRREQAEVVRAELARLNRLFQNLIDMARIESRAVVAEREWVTPGEVIDAAAQQAEASLIHHRLVSDPGSEFLLIRLDPRLTSAALAHVLENAAQHSPAGSAILVRATAHDTEIRFVVQDHGHGLHGDGLRARSSAGSGSGMGLAISRGLLKAEGGRLWGENRATGGAVFTVAIPVEIRTVSPLEAEVLT